MNKKEKKFVPKRGQIDFSKARFAPVINCVVTYKRKILMVRRNPRMRLYPGCWNGISGFLDDHKSLEEKVAEELREELGILKKHIHRIRLGQIFLQDAPEYRKTWIVHPVHVEVATDHVTLDWEAAEYAWLSRREVEKLSLMPGFETVLKNTSRSR